MKTRIGPWWQQLKTVMKGWFSKPAPINSTVVMWSIDNPHQQKITQAKIQLFNNSSLKLDEKSGNSNGEHRLH